MFFLLTGCTKSAEQKQKAETTCISNMKTVQSASNIYAAEHDGKYPTSWEEIFTVVEYWDEPLTCPLDGSELIIEWHDDMWPTVECPNHGKPYQ